MADPLLDAILDEIAAAERLLLISHQAPDGDAIGSLLGMTRLLRGLGKTIVPACQDPPPLALDFLPGIDEIVASASGPFDLVISLDCSDADRLGKVMDPATLTSVRLINIDHHVTNVRFGSINWVDPTSVATTQMVLALADYARRQAAPAPRGSAIPDAWLVDADVATCLLTGLVTDTRGFRTANVDARALQAAVRLIDAGAVLATVTQLALNRKPVNAMRLWGLAIARLQLEDGLLWTHITHEMRAAIGVRGNSDSGLSSLLSDTREAEVVVVFTEQDGDEIDVSMRAAPGLDISGVALALGGGGHPQASGCTMRGSLQDVEPRVLAALRHALAQQRQDDERAGTPDPDPGHSP
jgi:phosphoesterase RecJ-like protein